MADKDDLAEGLAGLSRLLTGEQALEQTLVRIAQFAVRAVPGAQGAGLTLLEQDRQTTVVVTDEFVRQVDSIQYGIGEGPCISAVEKREPVVSGNLGGESLWPRFGPRVGRLGVHSALSLPLLVPDRVIGALNIYAHPRDAFSAEALRLGQEFAGPAAVSVANAQLLAHAERLVGQLRQALLSRAQIDQAIGVVMSRSGVDGTEAFARLRAISQSRSVKVSVVAQELLDEAVRRARARHTADAPPGVLPST